MGFEPNFQASPTQRYPAAMKCLDPLLHILRHKLHFAEARRRPLRPRQTLRGFKPNPATPAARKIEGPFRREDHITCIPEQRAKNAQYGALARLLGKTMHTTIRLA
jgi:hypothetical protein